MIGKEIKFVQIKNDDENPEKGPVLDRELKVISNSLLTERLKCLDQIPQKKYF